MASTFGVKSDFNTVKLAIHRKLIQRMDMDHVVQLGREGVRKEVTEIVEKLAAEENTPMTFQERERLSLEVLDEVFGLGPLEPLLHDHTISDILVNTFNSVYIERNGLLERTTVQFRDDAHLMSIIDRIISAVGRRVDESSPMVDARLPGWLPRQRHHSSACHRRAYPLHPPFRKGPSDCRRTSAKPHLNRSHAGACCVPACTAG